MPSITRRSQSGRAQRRDEVRDRLLAVVQQLLTQGESYTEISVERLVAEAGISRSTFYVYFEDKGDLLRAWFGAVIDQLQARAGPWWELGPDAERDDLHKAMYEVVQAYRPQTDLMAALYDISAYDPTARELVDTMMNGNIAGLIRHIRRGQAEGWIDAELAPKETSQWLMWMAERGLHQMLRGADDAEADRLIDAFVDIMWQSLYARAPTRLQPAAAPAPQ